MRKKLRRRRFDPRITTSSEGDVRVWTDHGQDYVTVDVEGRVRRCRADMVGADRLPVEWV